MIKSYSDKTAVSCQALTAQADGSPDSRAVLMTQADWFPHPYPVLYWYQHTLPVLDGKAIMNTNKLLAPRYFVYPKYEATLIATF